MEYLKPVVSRQYIVFSSNKKYRKYNAHIQNNKMKIRNYKDLNIWKRSIELVKNIYEVSNSFPKEELYVLTSQLRRTAISIPSNIAEGFSRFHNKEYRQFLYIALGSCAELETQMIIANYLKYLNDDKFNDIINESEVICKMISNLIKKINDSEKA